MLWPYSERLCARPAGYWWEANIANRMVGIIWSIYMRIVPDMCSVCAERGESIGESSPVRAPLPPPIYPRVCLYAACAYHTRGGEPLAESGEHGHPVGMCRTARCSERCIDAGRVPLARFHRALATRFGGCCWIALVAGHESPSDALRTST